MSATLPGPSVDDERRRRLLTTSEAARMLGASRQTVVALCDAGDLAFTQVGTHRRIDPDDVAALRDRSRRRPRSAQRSLWLAYAVAGLVAEDPEGAIAAARQNLASIWRAGPRGRSRDWLRRWEQLLDGPVDDILEVLTGRTVEHDELRQHSPFTAALSEQRRAAVLEAFRRTRPHAGAPASGRPR